MKKYNKYISKILSGIFCLTIILLIGVVAYQIGNAEQVITNDIPFILEKSVRENIDKKAPDLFYSANYEYNPDAQKIGEYETKVSVYPDTTFTYQSRIVDPLTASFRALQTGFLNTKQLHADSIYTIFDSLLHAKNIHVKSVVGITASFYTELNDWSNDTAIINPNFRTIFANQGLYEDINYHAYIHYSYRTLWKLMSTEIIYALLICIIALGFIWIWWTKREIKRKRDGIRLLEDGNYQIKDVLFDIEKRLLITDKHEVKLTTQLYELFLMFLQSEGHRVSKTQIKKRFWATNADPTNNMTSGINRLKTELKEIGCNHTIYSDPENEEFYILLSHAPL